MRVCTAVITTVIVSLSPGMGRYEGGNRATMTIHVGTSGWSYAHWDGVLYPPATPPRERLEHYVRRFRTAELNASFYRWPRAVTFAGWRRRLPDGFQLSVKAPRG